MPILSNKLEITLDLVKKICGVRRERIAEEARTQPKRTHYIEGGSIWDAPCDMTMLAST